MSSPRQEHVLVVPTSVFRRLGHFQGFSPEVDHYLPELLRAEHLRFMPRGQAESDPAFKQLIPYVIFRHVDARGRQRVFEYTRGAGQGEGRLHSKRSVGVGGHIASTDHDGGSAEKLYREGMRRELEEEVVIDTPYVDRCVGLINDDQTEVGRVHLGVVHCLDVEEPNVKSREIDLIESGFHDVEELLADLDGFETWSSICLTALFSNSSSVLR